MYRHYFIFRPVNAATRFNSACREVRKPRFTAAYALAQRLCLQQPDNAVTACQAFLARFWLL